MNRPLFKRIFPQALAWVALVALSSVMALSQDTAPSNGSRTDGQIEMDVVHALDASQALKNDLITAATIQSEVTLSGTVSSDASKQLAESIAKGVPGVAKIHNNLKVGNPADDPNAQTAADQGQQDMADNQQEAAPAPPAEAAPAPDYGQNAPQDQNAAPNAAPSQAPGYGQNAPPPPAYGQNQYPPPPPPYSRPQYGAQAPPPPQYEMPKGPVTMPEGTVIQVRTSEPVDSRRAKPGESVQFTVIQDVVFGGVLAVPRGATVHGVIADAKRPESGALTGSSELALQLTSLDLGGRSYPIQSDLFKVKGPGKGGRTANNVVGGALLGAIIGGAVGRGPGAAIGAAAGGGAGVAASAASSGPGVWIPAEALVTFHLTTPITVQPVSQQEAMRLAQGLYPGGPSLYRRGGPYGYPYRPYYGYAPVYYRPYYMMGGYYYWR